jgi:hypothetical protein
MTKRVIAGSLRSGTSRSCGCLKNERAVEVHTKHGHSSRGAITREYRIYRGIVQRCDNPKNKDYHNYGGRGIKNMWVSFTDFLKDMGPCPHGMTIERIDNDGNYCKGNCVWVTHLTQQSNRRDNRFFEYCGVTLTISQWSRYLHISWSTLYGRLNKLGWSTERAFTEPIKRRGVYDASKA